MAGSGKTGRSKLLLLVLILVGVALVVAFLCLNGRGKSAYMQDMPPMPDIIGNESVLL